MSTEEQKAKAREATRRYRERLKAKGIDPYARTAAERKADSIRQASRRAAAKQRGEKLPGDDWAARNPERHRENGRRWRSNNLEYKRALDRDQQEKRRSTPWGKINNNMQAILHWGVRNGKGGSKYTDPLGYTWADLRTHLEAQFSPDMNWDNWGSVWEIDHIKPLSLFKYESLEDPLYAEAWALSNLRPLPCIENMQKGARYSEGVQSECEKAA